MGETRVWRQTKERVGWKVCLCGFVSVVLSTLNVFVGIAIGEQFAAVPILLGIPVTAFLSAFGMGFVEQRFSRHWTYSLVAAVATLLPPWCLMRPMSQDELAICVGICVSINWMAALGGSAFGTAFSGRLYTIVIGPPGTCSHCGYPLKGLPTNRCPECGREFDQNEKETGPQ